MKRFFDIYGGVMGTLLVSVLMLMPVFVHGQIANTNTNMPLVNADSQTLDNPLGTNVTSFCQLIIKLVQVVIALGIPVAVLFIVWAGFKFIIARGNPNQLTEAKKNFLYVIIGIGIFVGASLIANIIIGTLHQLGVQGINSC
jgi:hypothetical protein